MIRLPEGGVATSVDKHNCNLTVMADWVEGWSLLSLEEVSRSDVRDILLEQQVYRDQDFAEHFLGSLWGEISQRMRWLSAAAPLEVVRDRIAPRESAEEASAHRFLLTLSLAPNYSAWRESFGKDYREQGEMFERVVEAAAAVLFPGWVIHRTGWTSKMAAKLRDVVHDLAAAIGAEVGDIDKWADESAKECGLDLVWFRPFSDSRPAVPIYLAQCASGANWKAKLDAPDIRTWSKLLEFPQTPGKVFTIPFSLDGQEHIRRSNTADAVLLDRYRILYAGVVDQTWQSEELRERLEGWLQPRIDWMQDVD